MQETKVNTNNILEIIEGKDNEIKKLNDEITTLKQTNTHLQQFNSNITVEYNTMSEQIKTLYNQLKNLERKTAKTENRNKTKENETQTTPENLKTTSQTDIYAVETSNNFNILSEEHSPTATTSPTQKKPDQVTLQTTQSNLSNPQHPSTTSKNQKTSTPPQETNNKKNNPPCQSTTKPKTSQITYTNYAETIIFCDSNDHLLNPELLCPDSSTSYIRCPTLDKAHEILHNSTFTNAQTFLLHCGTNDLEKTSSDVLLVGKINGIINKIEDDHPKSKIVLSSLLPRRDTLNHRVGLINNKTKELVKHKDNLTFVEHNEIENNT